MHRVLLWFPGIFCQYRVRQDSTAVAMPYCMPKQMFVIKVQDQVTLSPSKGHDLGESRLGALLKQRLPWMAQRVQDGERADNGCALGMQASAHSQEGEGPSVLQG